eukprot:54127_1
MENTLETEKHKLNVLSTATSDMYMHMQTGLSENDIPMAVGMTRFVHEDQRNNLYFGVVVVGEESGKCIAKVVCDYLRKECNPDYAGYLKVLLDLWFCVFCFNSVSITKPLYA